MNSRLREFLGSKKQVIKEMVNYSKYKSTTGKKQNRVRKKN